MKTITVIGADAVVMSQSTLAPWGAVDHIITGPEAMSVSDGYHTFDELYDHRIELFIALCRNLHDLLQLENPRKYQVWKSTHHSDGTVMDGWFVMGIGTAPGQQITYHLPLARWDDCLFAEERELAPEWDGHTSVDVIGRLKLIG